MVRKRKATSSPVPTTKIVSPTPSVSSIRTPRTVFNDHGDGNVITPTTGSTISGGSSSSKSPLLRKRQEIVANNNSISASPYDSLISSIVSSVNESAEEEDTRISHQSSMSGRDTMISTTNGDATVNNEEGDESETDSESSDNNEEASCSAAFCSNCNRKTNTRPDGDFYNVKTNRFKRREIYARRTFRFVLCRKAFECDDNDEEYDLCEECAVFLTAKGEQVRDPKHFCYVWPSFYWKLLTNNEVLSQPHGGAQRLWKFVPYEWREWWLESLQRKSNHYNCVTMTFPPPLFEDKTSALTSMKNLLNSGFLPKIKKACNDYLMPTVLCPWGCTEYIHTAGNCDLDLVIQRHLPEFLIAINNHHENFKFLTSSRDDYVRDIGNEEYDSLLFNPEWKVLPSLAFIDGKGPCVLTCRKHDGGCKHHYIHPPRQPGGHILPSKDNDQLCHAVLRPRTIKQVKAKKYSTSFQIHSQIGSFKGIDTCDVRSFGRFDCLSVLLQQSEARSIIGRSDINCLLDKLKDNNVLDEHVVKSLREDAALTYPDKAVLDSFAHGSTYIPIEDAIGMQKQLGKENLLPMTYDMRKKDGLPEITANARRNWPSFIYSCQKFDKGFHGNYVCTIPPLTCRRNGDTKLTWLVIALVSRIKELWVLTESCTPLLESKWHGWVLSFIAKNCFSFRASGDRRNPFKSYQFSSSEKINNLVSLKDRFINDEGAENRFRLQDLSEIFMSHKRVEVVDSLNNNIGEILNDSTLVVIVNLYGTDLEGQMIFSEEIHNGEFELRFLAYINELNALGKWNGSVLSRHGGRFKSWWYQERKDKMPTHAKNGMNSISGVPQFAVYIRKSNPDFAGIKNDFLKSIGGQTHVRCKQHNYPLIRSSHSNKNKCSSCSKTEFVQCPDPRCTTALCKACFGQYDENIVSHIESSSTTNNNTSIDNDENNEDFFDIQSNDSSTISSNNSYEAGLDDLNLIDDGFNNDEDLFDESDSLQDNIVGRGIIFRDEMDDPDLVSTASENSLSDEEDSHSATHAININMLDNFVTNADDPDTLNENEPEEIEQQNIIPFTNAGETPLEVSEITPKVIYTRGHCIYNQWSSLLSRDHHHIQGSKNETHFIQNICATIPGESVPTLYPESTIFPSIFYHSGELGDIHGAIPSPLLSSPKAIHGFASILDHTRNRLSLAGTATSTNPAYISLCYDQLSNITASHEDSRIIMNRGMKVDDKNYSGLGVRRKNDSTLFDSVDSQRMVNNLCASQKYHKMDYFVTYTCNQAEHFGVCNIKNWVDNGEWNDHYPEFHFLPDFGKKEIHEAVVQAS